MGSVDEVIQHLEEAKTNKRNRRKAFDEVSCEQALKLVEKRKKKKKYESVEVEEENEIKEVRETQDTAENIGTLMGFVKKFSRNLGKNLDDLEETLEGNPRLKTELNVAILDVLAALKKAGAR